MNISGILSSCEPETIVSGLYKQNLLFQDGHLKPNEVYSTARFLNKDTKYEVFLCIPIYHINGSRYARASTTEHLVHFDNYYETVFFDEELVVLKRTEER